MENTEKCEKCKCELGHLPNCPNSELTPLNTVPTIEEHFSNYDVFNTDNVKNSVIEATKEILAIHLNALCEEIKEKADIYIPDGAYMDCYVNPDQIEIDKSSIESIKNNYLKSLK